MNLDGHSYDSLTTTFEWEIPPRYNIGVDVCDKWADGSGRLALIYEDEDGLVTRYTFDELKTLSDRFANVLLASGAQRGDRIGIFLSQSIETAIAHLGAYKAGMVAVPLFALFGVDAIFAARPSKPQRMSVNPAATQIRVFASKTIIGSGIGSPRAARRDRRALQPVSRLVATVSGLCRGLMPQVYTLPVR
ncbi:AMP-binding enzyme [Paraburkholderia hospita]|jgi:hypothetical protein|nr:AMP-binding enzyme [Paraburkholderia hospita]